MAWLLLGLFQGAAAAPPPAYRLVATVPLGAPDRWDYVLDDSRSGRVLVAHGDRTTVVDARSLAVVGQLRGLDGAHGQVVDPVSGHAYADSGRTGSVSLFDLATLRPLGRLSAAPDADAMVIDPVSRRVFVLNGDSGSITIIDSVTEQVRATIPLGSPLEFAAANGHGKLFVNLAEARKIARIDIAAAAVDGLWSVPDCDSPHGMAVDGDRGRLYTSCVNGRLLALDTASGRVLGRYAIGRSSDAVVFDARRRLVFSSNSEGTLSIFRQRADGTLQPQPTLATAPGARTMTIDPATGRLFLVSADVAGRGPPRRPGGPSSFRFKPGTVKLLVFDPVEPAVSARLR